MSLKRLRKIFSYDTTNPVITLTSILQRESLLQQRTFWIATALEEPRNCKFRRHELQLERGDPKSLDVSST
jgi:hypothetical protein